jgi:hypothetical protein
MFRAALDVCFVACIYGRTHKWRHRAQEEKRNERTGIRQGLEIDAND